MKFYKANEEYQSLYDQDKALTDIANFYETDKGNAQKAILSWGKIVDYPNHFTLGYTNVYERYMQKYRESDVPIRFLEIGVCDRRFPLASTKMWLTYFKNINLYCVDCVENCWNDRTKQSFELVKEANNVGANFILANQGSSVDWDGITEMFSNNKLDFIVEDGSHESFHMLYSLYRSGSILKSNAYYFMEDIQDPNTTAGQYGYNNVTVYESIINFMNNNIFENSLLTSEQCQYIQNNYKIVDLHHGGPETCKTLMATFKKI